MVKEKTTRVNIKNIYNLNDKSFYSLLWVLNLEFVLLFVPSCTVSHKSQSMPNFIMDIIYMYTVSYSYLRQ